MSVLITGMKLPSECADCDFCTCGTHCSALKFHDIEDAILHGTIYGGCPLIPVPDHGDLIDKTDLMESLADWQLSEAPQEGINWDSGRNVTSHELQYSIYRLLGDVYEEVRDEPVIIPAERREASLCDNCDEQSDAGCSWCKRTERSEE